MKSNPTVLYFMIINILFVLMLVQPSTLIVSAKIESSNVVINEIDYDQPDTDLADFIEIKNNDLTSINLGNYSLELVNPVGDGSIPYRIYDLPNVELATGEYYVVCSDSTYVANCDLDVKPDINLIQNDAPAAVALLLNSNIIDTVSYGGDIDETYTEGSGKGLEDYSTHANMGISRCPDGTDTDQNNVDFSYQMITAGSVNSCLDPEIVINEVDADISNFDTFEFIELYDGGIGDTALDGGVVVFYNGNGDVSYNAIDLDGYTTDANGYFLLGNSAVSGIDLVFSDNTLQDGSDAVAIYTGDATDFPNGTAVTTVNLIDAIVYATDDADDAGLLVLLNEGQPQVNENGKDNKDGHSNQRCPNGTGGLRNTDTYDQFSPTPGNQNSCVYNPGPVEQVNLFLPLLNK